MKAESYKYLSIADVLAVIRYARPDLTEDGALAAIAQVMSAQTMHPQLTPDQTAEVMEQEKFRYLFRAHVNGVFDWTCPADGHVNQTIVRPSTLLHRCASGLGCRRTYGLAHILHVLPKGRLGGLPEDMIVPAAAIDPMPLGEIGRYQHGKLAHRIRRVRGSRKR